MTLLGNDYYKDRPVPHTAQGDFYSGVPLAMYQAGSAVKSRGARKRPLSFLKPEPTSDGVHAPTQDLVVVCTYTCNYVAQPPGTEGYSHPLRQIAPVVPVVELINNRGLQRTEARKLMDSGFLSGLLYVPAPPGHTADKPIAPDEEFGDAYAVLLYAMGLVHQNVLDEVPRVARLSKPAQKLLIAGLIATVSASLYDPDDLEDPDMSSSWR